MITEQLIMTMENEDGSLTVFGEHHVFFDCFVQDIFVPEETNTDIGELTLKLNYELWEK